MSKDPKTREELPELEEAFDSINSAVKYQQGEDLLYKAGYLIVPDTSGSYAFHRVYTLHTAALEDTEIAYPDNFKVWRELATDDEREGLMDTIAAWASYGEKYEELFKFWLPFLKPNKNKNSPIYTYTEILIKERATKEKRNSGQPVQLRIAPNPVVSDKENNRTEQKELAPVKWIPKKDWFPKSLERLTIFDILSIYPKIEAELLALIIGRACVGRSNHLPPGYDEPLIHTSRMAGFVIGEDPGLGKTTLFTAIFQALESVGYIVETFQSFSSVFNMGPVVTADIVYKDDMTDGEFKSLTTSGVAKSLISGSAMIKVQDKGIDAYNVFPNAALFANFNNFNPRLAFGVDPGFAERAKCISTYREAELIGLEISELSKGSPDLRPFIHLDFLANRLGVSKRTMMLYFCRLCTDMFLEVISDRTSLEERVDWLSMRLRIPFNKDSTSQMMTFAICCHALTHPGNPVASILRRGETVNLATVNWLDSFQSAYEVLRTCRRNKDAAKRFKVDFENSPNDNLHPFLGLITIDPHSLRSWLVSTGTDVAHLSKEDPLKYLSEALDNIRLTMGLNYSKDPVWVYKAFEKCKFYNRELIKIADRINAGEDSDYWYDPNELS